MHLIAAVHAEAKKDKIGCQPERLVFLAYDDSKCTKLSKDHNLVLKPEQIKDITSDKCIKDGDNSYLGHCAMMADDKKSLDKVVVEYFDDDKC